MQIKLLVFLININNTTGIINIDILLNRVTIVEFFER